MCECNLSHFAINRFKQSIYDNDAISGKSEAQALNIMLVHIIKGDAADRSNVSSRIVAK